MVVSITRIQSPNFFRNQILLLPHIVKVSLSYFYVMVGDPIV
jgi:hypothetical protein